MSVANVEDHSGLTISILLEPKQISLGFESENKKCSLPAFCFPHEPFNLLAWVTVFGRGSDLFGGGLANNILSAAFSTAAD